MKKIKIIKLLIVLFILAAPIAYFFLSKEHDLNIEKGSLNCLCQEDKKYRAQEKGGFSDKLFAKEYISKNFPEVEYAKVLFSTKNPDDLKNFTLPDKFVMKSTSGARMFHIGNKNDNIKNLIKKSKYFLSIKFSSYGYRSIPFFNFKEPHYDYNDPKIIIEEFLEDIFEFRIMMAKGKVIYCEKINKQAEIYDENWDQLKDPKHNVLVKPLKKEKPKCFEQILKFCDEFYEKNKFNVVRMDFYLNKEETKFYFGEFTFTPENCRKKYSSEFNSRYSRIMNE
jgi:hypothetical protein